VLSIVRSTHTVMIRPQPFSFIDGTTADVLPRASHRQEAKKKMRADAAGVGGGWKGATRA